MRASIRAGLACAAAALAMVGCGGATRTPRRETQVIHLDGSTIVVEVVADSVQYAIWGNDPGVAYEGTATGRNSERTYHGRLVGDAGTLTSWLVPTKNGETGMVVIDGEELDPAKGRWFLVDLRPDGAPVVQLRRAAPADLELAALEEELRGMATNDPDVARFLAAR